MFIKVFCSYFSSKSTKNVYFPKNLTFGKTCASGRFFAPSTIRQTTVKLQILIIRLRAVLKLRRCFLFKFPFWNVLSFSHVKLFFHSFLKDFGKKIPMNTLLVFHIFQTGLFYLHHLHNFWVWVRQKLTWMSVDGLSGSNFLLEAPDDSNMSDNSAQTASIILSTDAQVESLAEISLR